MSNENYSKGKSLQKQLYRKNSINFLEDNSGDVFNYFGIIDPRYSDSKREGIPYASTYVINKNECFRTHGRNSPTSEIRNFAFLGPAMAFLSWPPPVKF